jgi:hypothetical protein
MHTTVTTDDAALAETLQAIDESLRKSFAAMPVDDVAVQVRRSMDEASVELSDATVREYAQHISDRADYELVVPA